MRVQGRMVKSLSFYLLSKWGGRRVTRNTESCAELTETLVQPILAKDVDADERKQHRHASAVEEPNEYHREHLCILHGDIKARPFIELIQVTE